MDLPKKLSLNDENKKRKKILLILICHLTYSIMRKSFIL